MEFVVLGQAGRQVGPESRSRPWVQRKGSSWLSKGFWDSSSKELGLRGQNPNLESGAGSSDTGGVGHEGRNSAKVNIERNLILF